MFSQPQEEHKWLERLVGEWTFEGECVMGPDQPPFKSTGVEVVRSIGGLWTVGEGRNQSPTGEEGLAIMTLGYDPVRGRYIGTFIASMMTHLWVYEGSLDASGKILTLDTTGPKFDQQGMAQYQDIIELVDDNHRTLSSQVLGDDGQWNHFMTGHYRRRT